jgi:predicted DNA-binding protein with PD1-like motif
MQSKYKDNLLFLRLFSGEDLFDKLREVCNLYKVKTAVVVSGLGQLQPFTLGYFEGKDEYNKKEFQEPHELVALTGIISRYKEEIDIHLHAALGGKDKETKSGHLFHAKVAATNELVLLTSDVLIKRKHEEQTGLRGMFLE